MAIAWPKEKCQSSTKKATPFRYSTKNTKKDRWNLKVLSSEKKLLLFHIWHSEKGDIFLFWEPPNWVNCGPEKKTLLRICILLFPFSAPAACGGEEDEGAISIFGAQPSFSMAHKTNEQIFIIVVPPSRKERTGLTFRIQLVRAASNSKHGENKKKSRAGFPD